MNFVLNTICEQGESGGSVYGIEDPATRAPIADDDTAAGDTVRCWGAVILTCS